MPDHAPDSVHALLHHAHAPGACDAITDVAGVRVGQVTVREGSRLHTGVTAVVPDALTTARASLPCAVAVGNGHGKLIGATQIAELGALETPIVLTSTLSAFRAADALVGWMLARPGHERTISLNPVVGECNDGWLSDIRTRAVTDAHVVQALESATPDRPEEGSVGAGTGMDALGFKAGIGTASRTARIGLEDYVVGVLVQANFSGTLRVAGRPVLSNQQDRHARTPDAQGNSCMIVLATNAPLDARQLGRVARRAVYAMGRLGADYRHGSGDYAIAFSTVAPARPPADAALNPVFTATLEATEAAILQSLLASPTTVGREGRVAPGLTWEHLTGA
ncbi:P1 family peptidase [Luteipulveratus flavus]|uniref:P1 family peptidase n=1 Tax=Luteipulveratus flavus TaxID=3031728 RepID=A0ABT6C578_9MICO|nr:P1 family peptidase [Luteipulveratus sp. YIM 133296]MDF8263713.1 P1 family peptidase [Luteipulveratus sp. YIM 133296]